MYRSDPKWDPNLLVSESIDLLEHWLFYYAIVLAAIAAPVLGLVGISYAASQSMGALTYFLLTATLLIVVRSSGGKRFIARYKMRERMRYGLVKLSRSQRWRDRPSVVSVISRPGGYVFRLRIPPGMSESDIKSSLGHLEVILDCMQIEVVSTGLPGSRVDLHILWADPFETVRGSLPRWLTADRLEPEIGIDEFGQPVDIWLEGTHVLVGGTTGSGKTNIGRVRLCFSALCSTSEIYILDGKESEFSTFREVACDYAGRDIDGALNLLKKIQAEVNTRFDFLSSASRPKLSESDGFSDIELYIDELGVYMNHPDKQRASLFAELLNDLASRARAARVSVWINLQKPATEALPSSIRDNFTYRIAMKTMTKDASDTILGRGLAAEGYNSASIPNETKGVGYALLEGSEPVLFCAYFLRDDLVDFIVAEAGSRRRKRSRDGIIDRTF